MASLLQSHKREVLAHTQFARPHNNQMLVLAAAVVPLIAISLLVRGPLVLPTLSLVCIASAAAIALLAWWVPPKDKSRQVTLWDVAGLYAFVGCAAGMLSEPEQVMEFLTLPAGAPENVGQVQ